MFGDSLRSFTFSSLKNVRILACVSVSSIDSLKIKLYRNLSISQDKLAKCSIVTLKFHLTSSPLPCADASADAGQG
jgi:hypothetical protein